MFVQLSHYQITPGNRQKCIDLMTQLKPGIMALPGLRHFMNVIKEDDSGYVFAVMESKEVAATNEPRVKELWAGFSKYLESLPAVEGHDIIADWTA